MPQSQVLNEPQRLADALVLDLGCVIAGSLMWKKANDYDPASEKNKLIIGDLETLRLHYALTGRHWYRRTVENREAIVAMYDERFYRLWQFYLAASLTLFRDAAMGVYQLQYLRRREATPLTRDYMFRDEQRLLAGTNRSD